MTGNDRDQASLVNFAGIRREMCPVVRQYPEQTMRSYTFGKGTNGRIEESSDKAKTNRR